MKKTIKIFLILGLAATMLFAVIGLSGCGYRRHPHSDPAIGTELEIRIRQDLLVVARENSAEKVSYSLIRYISIPRYLGTYNGYVAILLNIYNLIDEGAPLRSIPYEIIGQISGEGFIVSSIINLGLVWKGGRFYRIHSAYEQGFISQEDYEKINYLIK